MPSLTPMLVSPLPFRLLSPALLLGLLLAAAPARAEPSDDAEAAAAVSACLAEADAERLDGAGCIGAYANACLKQGRDPTTSGMSACYYRETQAWETHLNALYKRVMAALPKDKAVQLRDSERSWIETRKSTCGFYFAFYDGGTIARPVSAACYNRHTAERALFLKGFADELSGRP